MDACLAEVGTLGSDVVAAGIDGVEELLQQRAKACTRRSGDIGQIIPLFVVPSPGFASCVITPRAHTLQSQTFL